MPEPALSVILPTDSYETARRILDHVRAQTVSDRIEVVLVAPEVAALGGDEQVVRVPDLDLLSAARAVGIAAARAPVVVLCETHCYPDGGWAEALLDAQRGPWAGVAPQILNANPGSTLSGVSLVLDYGPWLGPTEGGELEDLPGHNSSYKRDVLLAFGDELGQMLEAESVMHAELRRRGHRLYQEPKAVVRHLNVTRWRPWLVERYENGRRFAAARAHRWPRWRRALYAAGSPLIPLVRFVRLRGSYRTIGGRGLPAFLAALATSACGELVGYAFGSGTSLRMTEIELHKERFAD